MRRGRSTVVALAFLASAGVGGAVVAVPAAAGQGVSPHSVVAQDPQVRKAAVAAAQADSAAMVKAVGLSADNAFTVRSVVTDRDGATHVHVDRVFKGLPVVGGDLVIHRDRAGRVTGHDGAFDGAITVALAPRISVKDATPKGLAAARAHKAKHKAALATATAAAGPRVVYVDAAGGQHLAYQVTTTGVQVDKMPSRVTTLVDAGSGAPLRSTDAIHAGKGSGIYDGSVPLSTVSQDGVYYLQNPSTGNYSTDAGNTKSDGSLFRDSDDQWGNGSVGNRQSAAVDAQFGADKTFEFYKTVLGRNGIWDNGQGARSRVHYDTNFSNAFWDGTQMTYGDGYNDENPLTELDVAAHEMSHGVTENTAGLAYEGDAGGLNEATSDIFGTAVEWYANLASDKPDYLMGELIDINGNGTPLRYMDKPSKDGVSPDCWSTSTASLDPHQASGPLNHWYYLASEGSGSKTINGVSYNSPTCNAKAVTGAGHGNIEKVWYRALATRLTSTSDYKAAREAAITSAIELYGASSQTCTSVQQAFDAINVPKGKASCSATTPTPGNAVVNGDFEQGQTGWTGTAGAINSDSGMPAHGGSWKMWLGGNATAGTEYEQQQVTVPAGAKLTYWVGIGTDETTTTAKRDTATVTVDGKTVATYSNLDHAETYSQKTIDLSSFAGKTVTLKFSATENAGNATTFLFDDVSLG